MALAENSYRNLETLGAMPFSSTYIPEISSIYIVWFLSKKKIELRKERV
jgi:hypothetical protein